jgi:hypothetical protein
VASVRLHESPGGMEGEVFAGDTRSIRTQVARILSVDVDGDGFSQVGRRDPVVTKLKARLWHRRTFTGGARRPRQRMEALPNLGYVPAARLPRRPASLAAQLTTTSRLRSKRPKTWSPLDGSGWSEPRGPRSDRARRRCLPGLGRHR